MRLIFVKGEIQLPPHHAAFPDVDMMVDDIQREMRELHAGRIVIEQPGHGPDVLVQIGQVTP